MLEVDEKFRGRSVGLTGGLFAEFFVGTRKLLLSFFLFAHFFLVEVRVHSIVPLPSLPLEDRLVHELKVFGKADMTI